MSKESREVAGQLQEWAKRMGFVPGSKYVSAENYPSVEDFEK